MFMCEDCGAVFDEPKYWKEYRGECHGTPAYETVCGCPVCLGSFDEYTESEENEE